MRILVVEDEPELANFIGKGLRQAGFAVDLAPDGETAIEKATATPYEGVVLDRQLPGMHGDDVCRHLLATSPTPRILMLTAASEIAARVDGLALGADDYMAKPFAMVLSGQGKLESGRGNRGGGRGGADGAASSRMRERRQKGKKGKSGAAPGGESGTPVAVPSPTF